MASLSEMYSVASAMQRDKLAADPLYSGTKAFGEGLSSGFKRSGTQGTKGIEQALKLMELKAKMEEYKHKQEVFNFNRDVLKAEGIIPYDEDEKLIARDGAFEEVSAGTADPSTGVKTEAGKVTQLVNKARKMNGGKDYEIRYGGSVDNLKMNIKHVKGEKVAFRQKIEALAEKWAKRAYAEKVYESAGGRENVGFMDADKIQKYIPTPAEMEKYRSLAQAYLSGKEPEKADPRKSLKEKDGKKDSVAGIGDLPGVEGLWDLLK